MGINIHQAKTQFSKILERVSAGEDVVISRAGQPVAVVVGIERYHPPRQLGFAPAAFVIPSLDEFNAPLDEETFAAFSGQ